MEDTRFDFYEIINIFIKQFNILEIFLTNRAYKTWQNTTTLWVYEKDYGNTSHLKLINNGLLCPDISIDISNNPGRRVIRDAYIEAVSSTIFIGEDF